jgi:hypothetical protein
MASKRAISRIIKPIVRGFNARNMEKAITDTRRVRRDRIML